MTADAHIDYIPHEYPPETFRELLDQIMMPLSPGEAPGWIYVVRISRKYQIGHHWRELALMAV
jgi:hypothetical protein